MGVWCDLWVAPSQPVLLSRDRLLGLLTDLLDEQVVAQQWAAVSGQLGQATPLLLANQLVRSGQGPDGRPHEVLRVERAGETIVDRPSEQRAEDYIRFTTRLLAHRAGNQIELSEERRATLRARYIEARTKVMTVGAFGRGARELAGVLAGAPYGQQDLAVYFPGLDFGNRRITDEYRWNADVAVYALLEPVQRRDERSDEDDEDDEAPTTPDEHLAQTYFSTSGKGGPEAAQGLLRDVLVRHFGNDLVDGCEYS
jgi:hypothetical protein